MTQTANLYILFTLLPCMLVTYWAFTWVVNKAMGFSLKEVYENIYKDPIASAILRIGILFCNAWIVTSAYERIV